MSSLKRSLTVTFLSLLFATSINAHTLPISDLTLMADENYLHLELSLNPTELNFFSELASSAETQNAVDREQLITRKLLEHLSVKVGTKSLSAETAGTSGDGESHHVVMRAHFPLGNATGDLQVESRLCELTGASHFTQVTFRKDGISQLARFDSQTRSANFGPLGKNIKLSRLPVAAQAAEISLFVPLLVLGFLPMALMLIAFRHFTRDHSLKEMAGLPGESSKI